jgi:hypothetical protein
MEGEIRKQVELALMRLMLSSCVDVEEGLLNDDTVANCCVK